MINKLLITCLQRNKRLVIPTLGAFIRKNIEGVGVILVFVPFLNKDDGVLCSAIKSWAGVEDEEATQILEEYIVAVKNSLDQRGQYIIEGVGVLKYDTNKIIYLAKESEAIKEEVVKPIVEQKPEIVVVEPEKKTVEPEQIVETPKVEPTPAPVVAAPEQVLNINTKSHVAPNSSGGDDSEPVKEPQIPQYNRPIYDRSTQTDMGTRYFSPVRQPEDNSSNIENEVQQPRQNPASIYGQVPQNESAAQPQQNNNGYGRYRDPQQRISNIYGSTTTITTPPSPPQMQTSAQQSERVVSSLVGANKRPSQRSGARTVQKKKGNDMVLWVAIIAVALTVMVLIYGYIYGGEQTIDTEALIEQVQTESGAATTDLSPTTGVK